MNALDGLHHLTAITGEAAANLDFYTRVLGLRLVKKTVNQDDLSAYHLFYADAVGSPGTDVTFFDWRHLPRARVGAGLVTEVGLRVRDGGDPAGVLARWKTWLEGQGVACGPVTPAAEAGDYPSLPFTDPEGLPLRLVAEPEGEATFYPWKAAPLSPESAVVGLSEVTLTVFEPEATAVFLENVLGFRKTGLLRYETGAGGPGARLRLAASPEPGFAGAGGVHHVAWKVKDREELEAWKAHLRRFGVGSSGPVDRHYFESLYFRIPGGILFELATEGPGFTADGEPAEHLGESLALPPFLEKSRAQIEAGLRPLPKPKYQE